MNKITKITKSLKEMWDSLSPLLIKFMFVGWFIPEVINPKSLISKLIWLLIGSIVIVLSWSAVYYNIVKPSEEKCQ